jgi:hypothetical protein
MYENERIKTNKRIILKGVYLDLGTQKATIIVKISSPTGISITHALSN